MLSITTPSVPVHKPFIADTGATSHFVPLAQTKASATRATTAGITVRLPNGDTMKSTHQTKLNIPSLPPSATWAHAFPTMNRGLVSIGQLCDSDCTAQFTKTAVTVTKNNKCILRGNRDPKSGLYTLPSLTPIAGDVIGIGNKNEAANSVYELTTKRAQIQFLHRVACNPVKTNWIQAINKGFFTSWPGLDSKTVDKHLPTSAATIYGHQRQQYQGVRSTQTTTNNTTINEDANTVCTAKTHEVFAVVVEPPSKVGQGQVYTDQTGRFPHPSSRGYKYIMVLYDYDSNAILAEPMKSRTGDELTRVYTKLHTYLTERGHRPRLQKLDNEAPASLKIFLRTHNVDYQLVPPNVHRRNAAERAIGTFKEHFISTLAGTHSTFPTHLWDRLIPQCVATLNMLRQSRVNTSISAYTQLNGVFDFNKTPMMPPGARVLVHEKPAVRRTWDPHCVEGFYLGPAEEHYRCYRVYVTETGSERITDTLDYIDEADPLLRDASRAAVVVAADRLAEALQYPTPSAVINKPFTDNTRCNSTTTTDIIKTE